MGSLTLGTRSQTLGLIDDEVTAVFMTSFYRALMCGRAPAAALRQAQADTRSLYTHPYFWAAFTLYGGW